MTSPQSPPPNPPRTLLKAITQVVQTVQSKIHFSQLTLKPNARVPELWVQDGDAVKAEIYPLLGDRYLLGRSSKQCDIVVRNAVVSQVHLSLARAGNHNTPFVIRDEQSTNGIYRGKRRLNSLELRHGDVLTLGPPELAAAVKLRYVSPPAWYIKVLQYSLYGFTGLSALVGLWVMLQWQRFSVYPLPTSVQGPIIIYAGDGQTPLRVPRTRAHLEMKRLSDFSPYLPNAVMASEDSRFFWHFGIDPIGIFRALVTNLRGGGIREGGSTISQQVARSLFREYVGTEDSAGRKIREAVVALKLETFYSKEDLLLMYLNRVYLGSGTYGFEDAAQFYFAKAAKDLTLSEAATLVGILPAPNSFNPVQDYETAVEFRDRVISRMAAQGKVTAEEAQRARRSRIEINPAAIEELRSTIAPYFYSYIFDELEDLLGEQLAQEGNFVVESTLNIPFQQQAEASLRRALETDGSTSGFSEGALVTLNAETGGILAMMGGYDYQTSQFNRATQALRQPGSTFKVFAFTAAIEQGLSPGKSYSCADLTWSGQAFEGCRYSRASSLDMATGLALSENVVALRVAQDVGLDQMGNTARQMGIESDLNPVPGLVLGQSEVTLLELTGAYGTLANGGTRQRPHGITRILDSSDCRDRTDPKSCRVIYDVSTSHPGVRALPPETTEVMTDLLQGVIRGGTGRNAYLGLGEAGKTGTSNDNRDLWFVGYLRRQDLVTGIWFGNDDNSPTSGSSAQAAQLWGNYMGRIVQ